MYLIINLNPLALAAKRIDEHEAFCALEEAQCSGEAIMVDTVKNRIVRDLLVLGECALCKEMKYTQDMINADTCWDCYLRVTDNLTEAHR